MNTLQSSVNVISPVSGRVDYNVPTPMDTKSTLTDKLFIKSLTMYNIIYSQKIPLTNGDKIYTILINCNQLENY